MVTVNLEKARAIVHEARISLFQEKTKEYFDTLVKNTARIDHLPDGAVKTDLQTENATLAASIEACVADDSTLVASIDAANDADTLEALIKNIDEQMKKILDIY